MPARIRGGNGAHVGEHRVRRRAAVKERGALAPGYHADLLLFDPSTVNRTPNRRVFDLPAGQPRLAGGAVGVHGVWVNGVRIADGNGVRAGAALAGRLLREFASEP